MSIENVRLLPSTRRINEERFALSWEEGADRFHVWCSLDGADDLLVPEGTVYKNSQALHGEPGYYNTRKLAAAGRRWQAAIAAALKVAASEDLVARSRAAAEQAAAHERLVQLQATHASRVRETAPELLAALKNLHTAALMTIRRIDAREPVQPGIRDELRRSLDQAEVLLGALL